MEDILALKILKLTSPTIKNQFWDYLLPHEILNIDDSLAFGTLTNFGKLQNAQESYPSFLSGCHSLIIPSQEENVLSGEPFKAYFNVTNISDQVANSVSIQVVVYKKKQTSTLFDNSSDPLSFVGPRESFDFLLSINVETASTYKLLCTISYCHQKSTEFRTIKKSFQFASFSPFDVKHKVAWLQGLAMVECTLQNVTNFNILLKDACLRCSSDKFDSSRFPTLSPASSFKRNLNSGIHLFKPGEFHAFLFMLKSNGNEVLDSSFLQGLKSMKNCKSIGQLDLIWSKVTSGGDEGAQESYSLSIENPDSLNDDFIYACITKLSSGVKISEIFEIELEIFNTSEEEIDISLRCNWKEMSPFFQQGADKLFLGRLQQGESLKKSISLTSKSQGVHSLNGLYIFDSINQQYSKQLSLGSICVL